MSKAQVWKQGAPGEPTFPEDFEVLQKAVLQVTDIKTNRNKYYAIELHQAGNQFRVFTHYGRTDDLETNPNAGVRESRYLLSLPDAQRTYNQIYHQKTSAAKGYQEVNLASSRIGSERGRGKSSGHMDAATLERLEGAPGTPKPEIKQSTLAPGIQDLVRFLYEEATNALTSTVAVRITANGIETPLGVLTLGQIEKGQAILDQLYDAFQSKKGKNAKADLLTDLSGEFYTVVPHRIGRSRQAAEAAVIDTLADFQQKQETLQLMRDMLKVNGDGGNVLYDDAVDQKYAALGCTIGALAPESPKFKELKEYIEGSQVKTKSVRVKTIYALRREEEHARYAKEVGNDRLLFHGSASKNWVGLLSRGILLPKIVVSMGVNRTDAGWLGHGIYFGDAVCTTLYYAHPSRRKTRLMAVASVALGKSKEFKKITYGLDAPPPGYDSCHGVRRKPLRPSEFEDDEFVVYRAEQQRLEYLVEYTG
ncbi:MAG: WGR domain-containing protein [Polyangiales bacterium]